jgi:calcineurin-like phosphoesterase family protein
MFKAFYSDPHLGHANIIEYCQRPFSSVEEMNRVLVDNYNRLIGPNDTVLWVGDCFFKGHENLLAQMNGHKVLVVGNHDRSEQTMARLGFDLVMKEAFLNIAGVPCRVNHWPYDGPAKAAHKRPRRRPGEVLLHGHDHSIDKVTSKDSINVGVDAWNFKPALYSEVAELVNDLVTWLGDLRFPH